MIIRKVSSCALFHGAKNFKFQCNPNVLDVSMFFFRQQAPKLLTTNHCFGRYVLVGVHVEKEFRTTSRVLKLSTILITKYKLKAPTISSISFSSNESRASLEQGKGKDAWKGSLTHQHFGAGSLVGAQGAELATGFAADLSCLWGGYPNCPLVSWLLAACLFLVMKLDQ